MTFNRFPIISAIEFRWTFTGESRGNHRGCMGDPQGDPQGHSQESRKKKERSAGRPCLASTIFLRLCVQCNSRMNFLGGGILFRAFPQTFRNSRFSDDFFGNRQSARNLASLWGGGDSFLRAFIIHANKHPPPRSGARTMYYLVFLQCICVFVRVPWIFN